MKHDEAVATYPVRFEVEYAAQQSRWRAALRLPLSLPALVFALFLQGGIVLAVWSAILVTGRIPVWLANWVVAVNRWSLRSGSYLALLTDQYPAFEGDYPIQYEILTTDRPSRWKVAVWKLVTLIPHAIALVFLTFSIIVVVLIAWFAILITGRFPRSLHSYVSGVLRWWARTQAYALSLTDEFPPFSLSAKGGMASTNSYVASSAVGVLLVGTAVTLFSLIVAFAGQHESLEVSYAELLAGAQRHVPAAEVGSGAMRLVSGSDPADESIALFTPAAGTRYVAFTIAIRNWRGANETVPVKTSSFRLEDANGDSHEPVMVGVDGSPGNGSVAMGQLGTAVVLFELPGSEPPRSLTWDVVDYISFPRVGETIVWNFE